MRGEFRRLKDNGYINIGNAVAEIADPFHDLRKEDFTVNSLPLIRGVRKEVADVSESEGAKEGVTEGMDCHIAVGMGYKAIFRRNLDAAEPHGKSFREGVDIITVAYSEIHIYLKKEVGPGRFELPTSCV